MQTFSKILAIASFAQVVTSSRLDLFKRDSPLEVNLVAVEGGLVKATVKNGTFVFLLWKSLATLDQACGYFHQPAGNNKSPRSV